MIDHIILGCKEIDEGIQFIYQKTSVMPQKGGRHPQWGTQNALLSLGQNSYLEVMAPIPGQATNYPFDSFQTFPHQNGSPGQPGLRISWLSKLPWTL